MLSRLQSFSYAIRGFRRAWKTEANLRIHIGVSTAVVAMGFGLPCTSTEWCLLLMAIGLVVSMELINTSIEKLCDRLHPEQDSLIGHVKDISAAAVLAASTVAVGVGLFLFIPKIFSF